MAFQSLVRPLLSKSEEELSKWRNALREALAKWTTHGQSGAGIESDTWRAVSGPGGSLRIIYESVSLAGRLCPSRGA